MRHSLLVIVCATLLTSCGDTPITSGIGSSLAPSTLDWTRESAGTIEVRGRTYTITKRTATDKRTGEVFVVEYSTTVNGQSVTCVGTIDNCPEAIEEELDNPRERGGGMY